MSYTDISYAVKKAFPNKTVAKQFTSYAKDINAGRYGQKVCSVKLPGPVVDQLVIGYPVYSWYMDRAIVRKYNIVNAYDMLFTERSNLDSLPPNYVIQTWHNAVDFHLHCLWQEYLGILHIPQIYPKKQYGNDLPPILQRSLELSIKIYDILERLQPHGVSISVILY